MLIEELLFEMPKSIEPTQFNLNIEKTNIKYAREFLSNKDRELLDEFSFTGNLYKIKNKIVLIEELEGESPRILYYVQWEDIFHKLVGHKATAQIAVWRNLEEPGLSEVSKKIFFDFLLPIHDVMITDALQTPDGRRFWINRISDAFNLNLNVYYLNLMQPSTGDKNSSREIIKINSVDEFKKIRNEKDFWGKPELFRARKLIISSIDIS